MSPKNNNEENTNEVPYQVNNYIHQIHDLVTRIDERVKTIFKQLNDTDKKLEKLRENYSEVVSKINSLESHEIPFLENKINDLKAKMELFENQFRNYFDKVNRNEFDTRELKTFKKSTEEKVKVFVDILFKIIFTLGCGYIAYKLGWNK